MAKPIMIQGTASGVGKTILTLALCRIFKQDGHNVAPFKAQNMTANTFTTPQGQEIAVSQQLQAMAAGAAPTTDMNPVILTPSEEGTGVVVQGKFYGNITAANFKEIKRGLAGKIAGSYNRLCSKHDIIVIEGAGSPVELNLNQDDIVNMGMAKLVNAPVILVADIDRGGVFASLYGTVSLLGLQERLYVKATIVNRFRGDAAHFSDGVDILQNITQLPVAGVVPYINISLPEEDGPFNGKLSNDFENEFDRIAQTVRNALDMKLVYKIMHEGV